jgi:hypothetical protein
VVPVVGLVGLVMMMGIGVLCHGGHMNGWNELVSGGRWMVNGSWWMMNGG